MLLFHYYSSINRLNSATITKKHYSGSFYWVIASTLAWEISILLTAIGQESELVLLITFIIGSLLYGAITRVTLMWILKPKGIKS